MDVIEEDINVMPPHMHIHTEEHSCVPTYILTCMHAYYTRKHEERKASLPTGYLSKCWKVLYRLRREKRHQEFT